MALAKTVCMRYAAFIRFLPSSAQVCAAVVTCGGLCPGLNDVVQNIVYTLRDYGVPEDNMLGIRCGFCIGRRAVSAWAKERALHGLGYSLCQRNKHKQLGRWGALAVREDTSVVSVGFVLCLRLCISCMMDAQQKVQTSPKLRANGSIEKNTMPDISHKA